MWGVDVLYLQYISDTPWLPYSSSSCLNSMSALKMKVSSWLVIHHLEEVSLVRLRNHRSRLQMHFRKWLQNNIHHNNVTPWKCQRVYLEAFEFSSSCHTLSLWDIEKTSRALYDYFHSSTPWHYTSYLSLAKVTRMCLVPSHSRHCTDMVSSDIRLNVITWPTSYQLLWYSILGLWLLCWYPRTTVYYLP